MNIFMAMVMAVALFGTPAHVFSAPQWMRINLIEGDDVQVYAPDAGDWGSAVVNGPLREGDHIWVPEGAKVELQTNSGSYVRLAESSALQILSLDGASSQLHLSQGQVYIYYNAFGDDMLQVDTPDTSIRAFEGSVFRIDMSDSRTDVAIYKGYVEAENQAGQMRVDEGQVLSLAWNGAGELAPMGPPDNWEKWNKKRNDVLMARTDRSSRYLPPELMVYSYDFDRGGRWIHLPDYGYCWAPRVAIGWAPYRFGRWVWIGGDYVWISHDPWGWAPHHYGRWAFVTRIGWCWVPPLSGDAHWGPGFVGWVRTGNYVAWVPLAPGEIYYGRDYYGRHSVNIADIEINRINITHVLKNVHVDNGVTVVDRKAFTKGSHRIVNLNRNWIAQRLFIKDNITVGAKAVKPSRAHYFMTARAVPAGKHPPQSVRNVQAMDLKKSRSFVRDPGKSVINPGTSPGVPPLKKVTVPRTPGRERPGKQPMQGLEQGKPAGAGNTSTSGGKTKVMPQEGRPAAPQIPAPRKERPRIAPGGQKSVPTEGAPSGTKKKPVKSKGGKPVDAETGPQKKLGEKIPLDVDSPTGGKRPADKFKSR